MLNLIQQILSNQYEAVFCSLNLCIDQCPDSAWDAPVANHAYCQAVFHTLFFADVYLGKNLEELREQSFHKENQDFFRNYEELDKQPPEQLYHRHDIQRYLQHCRGKAVNVLAEETAESLQIESGFPWLKVPRAEVHVYNIRHIHHHVAQLSLRLRLDTGEGIPWVKSGWDSPST